METRETAARSDVEPWFELKLDHAYFLHPRFSDLIRLHPIGGDHVEVFTQVFGEKVLVYGRSSAPRPTVLSFGLEILNSEFFNYTQINDPSGDSDPVEETVIYFQFAGTEDATVEAIEAPVLSVRPRRFLQKLSQERCHVETLSLGSIGETVNALPVPQSDSRTDYYEIEANPTGSRGLEAHFTYRDGSKESARFFASDAFFQRPLPMALEWQADANAAASDQTPVFTLGFEARLTYWRYFLLGLPAEDLPDIGIRPLKIDGEPVTFETVPPPHTMPDGQEALVLQSKSPLALHELPSWKVLLQSNGSFDGQRLPYPDTTLSLGNVAGEAVFCSDSYVQF